MKKFILTLIIGMLFIIPFASTIGKLADSNTTTTQPYNLNNITTSTFISNNNTINMNLNGNEIDQDSVSILPGNPPYSNSITMMLNGTLNKTADAYNQLLVPSTLPTNNRTRVAYSPDSTKLVIPFSVTPFVRIYDITTDPMTIYTTLDTFVTQVHSAVAYHPSGNEIAFGMSNTLSGSPYITVYDATSTPYNRKTDPETLPGQPLRINYSPNGNHMAVGHVGAPYLTIYDTSTNPYTKIASPSVLPTNNVSTVIYSYDGTKLAVASISSPYLMIYDTSTIPYTYIETTFNPTLSGPVYDVVFTKDSNRLVSINNTRIDYYDLTSTPTYDRINTIAHTGTALDLNHNDTILTTEYQTANALTYDMSTFTTVSLIDSQLSPENISDIRYSPDGNRLVIVYASGTPEFYLYNTNIKYFDMLDQDGNVLYAFDYETTYTNEMINLAVDNLTGISFRSQGVDLTVPSSMSIDFTLQDAIITDDSPMGGVIRFIPLLGFIAIATIFIAYIMTKKR